MKKLIAGSVLIALLAVMAVGAYWWFDLRWRPKTVTKHQAEIARIVEQAGWVSPRLAGPKLYMVGFRTCPNCTRFMQDEIPVLQAAGVDTRVIMIARADRNGLEQSTPAERSTVAELWISRSWPLFERWEAAPPESWTAAGIPPADGDTARTAVVQASRNLVRDLTPLLKANGVSFAYPVLIWWTKDGEMKACACSSPRTHRFVRADLGA